MNHKLYPLLFKPVYKDYLWGGSRIAGAFGRKTGLERCAESWEISDRSDGMSIIENGALAGITLSALLQKERQAIMGSGNSEAAFPLLIKIIDARQRLSLQVHPDNSNAATVGGEPKTEMWYVLDSEDDAFLFASLKKGVDRETFLSALQDERLEETLHRLPAEAGSALFVPGGRLHAIGAGCLLLEVQQNSNTTYRVYDWGRVDDNGQPRELHLKKALQVMNWNDHHPEITKPRNVLVSEEKYEALFGSKTENKAQPRLHEIIECAYFSVEKVELRQPWIQKRYSGKMELWFTVNSAVTIHTEGHETVIPHGRTCLMPAALKTAEWMPDKFPAELIRITLPS